MKWIKYKAAHRPNTNWHYESFSDNDMEYMRGM